MTSSVNAGDLLRQGREQLAPQVEQAALETRWVLCHVLHLDEAALFSAPERLVTEAQAAQFWDAVRRRCAGEPLAYVLGRRAFYGEDFWVTPDTLIPRPETELLVERALAALPEATTLHVADLGTGSGAIAVTLARLRPAWQVLAIDRSAAALAVARRNGERQQCHNVHFLESDWLAEVTAPLDAIVCNPPYVAEQDAHLQMGDVRFEPRTALVAADNGLADFQRIITQSMERLIANGWLAFEHGWQQGEKVRAMMTAAGFEQVQTHRDLAGHERVTEGRKPC